MFLKLLHGQRGARVISPLGGDVLLLRTMSFEERLNGCFKGEIEVASNDYDIQSTDLLGEVITVGVDAASGAERFFTGIISDFAFTGGQGDYAGYSISFHPWTYICDRRQNCRIFQEMSAPEIIQKVVDESGFGSSLDLSGLTDRYAIREYCVQYNETDLAFIRRLMEEEGIVSFFEHGERTHVLKLLDWADDHQTVPGYESIPFSTQHAEGSGAGEHIFEWRWVDAITSGRHTTRDYDFSAPGKDLLVSAEDPFGHSHDSVEWFEWPGGYFARDDGDRLTAVRLDQLKRRRHVAFARADARGIVTGSRFKLTDYPRNDQNTEYVVETASHRLRVTEYQSGVGGGDFYECAFSCTPATALSRPERSTPKPRVHGAQTAIVVGPSGEEIWTDEHGRIKVQFPWDREGANDEKSSCWIRVAQLWAHQNWGHQYIPRIGQEVMVDFLEGDPDRPVVIGSLYNGDNRVPFELPANKTQSGWRSNSSKGGGGSNEFRFEDKKGSEEVFLHAEKDENIVVKNNATRRVGNDRLKSVGRDEAQTIGQNQSRDIGNNQTLNVGVDQAETIGNNQTITIGVNRTETVGADEQVTIGANRNHAVAIADNLTVGAAQQITVGAAQNISVGASQTTEVGAAQAFVVGGPQSTTVGAARSVDVKASESKTVGQDANEDVGKNYALNAGDTITLTVGKASLTMKKDGTIILKGKDITIDASGALMQKSGKDTTVKASGDVVIKGKKVKQN